MKHFGVVSPPVSGHINPMAALGRELVARGHRVTYFQVADLEKKIRAEELDFWRIGESDHPLGSLPKSLAELGRLQGNAALKFTIRAVERTSVMVCRDLPAAAIASGVDALLVDQMEPAGGAVAEHLGLPFVTICNALAINRDIFAPPPFTPWAYQAGWLARIRNVAGYAISDVMTRPIVRVVADYRRRWKLPTLPSPDASFSRLAQICQMPREFDFPRVGLPASFHYVGPLRRALPRGDSFPWERLDGRPIVYASLGTLQNSREPVFRCFADACAGLDVQLVMTHGGGAPGLSTAKLPGNPVVVDYAPQLDLLSRARLTITHAGLNTVLDSLSQGVPLITIPITYEQPAIARRVERTGAGRVISLRKLNPENLRQTLRAVLEKPSFAQSARVMSNHIREAGGVDRATDLILQAVLEPTGTFLHPLG